jgi:hypothetical protein
MKIKGVNRERAKLLLDKFYEVTINSILGKIKTDKDSYT